MPFSSDNLVASPNNMIAADFKHGANLKIGNFVIIEEGVEVGDDVTIENFAILHRGIKIGNKSLIGSYCEIGPDNEIGDNCIIQGRIRTAESCVIRNRVTVKYGTILTARVLLKDDAFLGPNVITLGGTARRETRYGTIIGERTYIGAGSKIVVATEVGDDVTVGAMTFINKNLEEPGVYVGIPVRKIK